MIKGKKIIGHLLFALCMVFCAFGISNDTHARTVTQIQESIMDKAVFQGLYNCYTGGYIQSSINPLSDFGGLSSFVESSKNSGENFVPLITGSKSESVFTGTRYSVSDGGLSCSQLISGGNYAFGGTNVNILRAFNKALPSLNNSEEVKEFMGNMGYAVTVKSGSNCYSLTYTSGASGNILETNKVCLENGNLKVEGTSGAANLKVSGKKVCVNLSGREMGCKELEDSGDFNGNWLQSVVKKACGAMTCSYTQQGYTTTAVFDASVNVPSQESLANMSANFMGNSASNAALTAVRYLSDNDSYNSSDSLKIDDLEKRVLYQAYLTSYYGVKVDCADGQADEAFDGTISWFDSNSNAVKTCHYDKSSAKNKNKKVNGVDNGQMTYQSINGLDDLITAFSTLKTDYTDEEIAEMTEIMQEPIEGASAGVDNTVKGKCGDGGAAGALGWIVCPILTWVQGAVEGMYNSFLKPNLQLEPQLFTSTNGNTRLGWEIFQGIANGLFIVLLLLVIFSQLTGIGIDNYGIKRILPKMIIAAVLVNLSFIICQVCVDLSNILGNGFQALFDNIHVDGLSNSGIDVGSGAGATITSVAILAGVGTAGVLSWPVIAAVGPSLLASLVISGIGVFISIIFLFILLAAREAAVVVLTVISPLAFVCYMLPNTKKFFDKWIKAMEALLLVYPIAGLLIGGGNYVSKLLLSVGVGGEGFIAALTAMVVGIVPIFFIPIILKNSFSAIGNIGARISGFGQRFGNGATRMARNSEAYKNVQRMGLERRTRAIAGIDKNGNLTKAGERKARFAKTGVGRALGLDSRSARYINAAKKQQSINEEAGAVLTNALAKTGISEKAEEIAQNGVQAGRSSSPSMAYYEDQYIAAAQKGNTTEMNAVLAAASSSGYVKDKDIAGMVRNNLDKINISDGAARATWMRDTASRYGRGFLATDLELQYLMQNSGLDAQGKVLTNLGNYGDYAASVKPSGEPMIGADDVKPEDILKLSGDSMAGLVSAGLIDQGMAQRIMSMNPNMSADKRIMMGATAAGMVGKGVDSKKFKNDAKQLANNHKFAATTINAGGADLEEAVNDWTSPTAVRATVVQDFFSDKDRQRRPVIVDFDSGAIASGSTYGAGPTPLASAGGTGEGSIGGDGTVPIATGDNASGIGDYNEYTQVGYTDGVNGNANDDRGTYADRPIVYSGGGTMETSNTATVGRTGSVERNNSTSGVRNNRPSRSGGLDSESRRPDAPHVNNYSGNGGSNRNSNSGDQPGGQRDILDTGGVFNVNGGAYGTGPGNPTTQPYGPNRSTDPFHTETPFGGGNNPRGGRGGGFSEGGGRPGGAGTGPDGTVSPY